jgi:uncharacterized protein (DUF924 family)
MRLCFGLGHASKQHVDYVFAAVLDQYRRNMFRACPAVFPFLHAASDARRHARVAFVVRIAFCDISDRPLPLLQVQQQEHV